MPEGFAVLTASPYTTLAGPGYAEGEVVVAPLPSRSVSIGEAFKLELKAALGRLKETYPKARELETNLRVGLALRGAQANVLDWRHPEADVLVNPKYLLDGLGLWPAVIRWEHKTPIVVVSNPGQPFELRYWLACMVERIRL